MEIADTLIIDYNFDRDNELGIVCQDGWDVASVILKLEQVEQLRDHLNKLLENHKNKENG